MCKSNESITDYDLLLDGIESKIDCVIEELKLTNYDNRDRLIHRLDTIKRYLSRFEESLTDEQYSVYLSIQEKLYNAYDTEYVEEDCNYIYDPYKEVGMCRKDFY